MPRLHRLFPAASTLPSPLDVRRKLNSARSTALFEGVYDTKAFDNFEIIHVAGHQYDIVLQCSRLDIASSVAIFEPRRTCTARLTTDSPRGVHDADGEQLSDILLLVGFNRSESERFDFGHAGNAGPGLLRPRLQPLAAHRLLHPPGTL